jgi:antitoxin Phd
MTSHIMVPMGTWQLQDAKARFSEFLDAAIEKGPQVVTRRGVEAAVLVPIEEWRRIKQSTRPSIKELLLSGPRFENIIPPRRKWKRRPPVEFE